MPRIHQLPPSVVTKIAAGEVIERPASVVKELLENAVDAGSTRIDVEVEQGGVELIRVVDNGCGIDPEDLALAFSSHATSKLTSADDLFRVRTLGFRGEALASIGGVAQVRLQSRPPDQPCGAELSCQGGELAPVRVWNGSPGTRIEVRHLFYNTPVRRKFLRTTATEMGHISEAFTRLALAHPTLHLTLTHNAKMVYEVPATAGLFDRLALFFGDEVANQLYRIETPEAPIRLHGYVGDPACERGNAKMQYLFVNGRWIRDRSLGHATQEAYRGLLMTGRYAVTFLFLDLPPDVVDVNVHPTKAEVRFRDAHGLYHLVLTTIRERLQRANLTPQLRLPPNLGPSMPAAGNPSEPEVPDSLPWTLAAPPPPPPMLPLNEAMPRPTNGVRGLSGLPPVTFNEAPSPALPQSPAPASSSAGAAEEGHKALQLYDAYLVLETQEGMLVIDQHALHERILFEQLKRRMQSKNLETQRLLIPEPVDLTAEQAARTLEQKEALAELGLGVEDFGGGTILLTSHPAILGHRSPATLLKAVVDHLMSKDRAPTKEQLLNDLLSLMACHAAVRSGDRLTPEEITALLEQRSLAVNTHHCPHGRPTSLLFSRHELDRQFRRT